MSSPAGRGQGGRFAPGTSGNPRGRAPRRTEDDYLDATIGAVPLVRWRRIVARAVDDAENGDDKARAFLAKALGLSRDRTDVKLEAPPARPPLPDLSRPGVVDAIDAAATAAFANAPAEEVERLFAKIPMK